MSAGYNVSAVTGPDYTAYSCGYSSFDGAPGNGRYFTQNLVVNGMRPVSLASGESHTLAAFADGSVYGWGANYNRVLTADYSGGNRDVPRPITSLSGEHVVGVACGIFSSYAVTADGELYGWGLNRDYNLGLGYSGSAGRPTRSAYLSLATEGWLTWAQATLTR
ncbi:MAG: hypothetical protein U5N86_09595 [Planctomycetota bacterium]|nr:hypothetical protein [Planctomycetota bacterium]